MSTQVSDDWYKSFFKGINCEVWENAIPADYTNKEVDFIVDLLQIKPGEEILDMPCGHGRHAIELAKRGYNVTGVDISHAFIETLNKQIARGQLSVTTIEADILDIKLNKTFAGAVCLGNSFGYFSFDKMKIFIEKVSKSLQPRGRFIINSGMLAESIMPNLEKYAKNDTYNIGNISTQITNTYDLSDSFLVSNIKYVKDGIAEEHAFKHYVFTLGEVKRLLNEFHLKTIAVYNSTDKSIYAAGDPQAYIVAEKTSKL